MSTTAKLRYLRIAPRKVRLLVNLIRGKEVKEAQVILNFVIKKGSLPLLKLLNQATASAVNDFQLDLDNLYISKINVDEGPKHKRWRARARGQAYEIQKKTSHITLVLNTRARRQPSEGADKDKKLEKRKKVVQSQKESKYSTEQALKKGKPLTKRTKPKPEIETAKPKIEKGVKRMFRRKSF